MSSDGSPQKKTATKAKKLAKPKAAPSHPPYKDMTLKAIATLKDRKGASRQAIVKYVTENFNVNDKASSHIRMALKKGVEAGWLEQKSGIGAQGRFRVGKVEKPKKKPAKKPAAKKPAAKKPAAKKTTAKKTATKKKPTTAKKATPKKKTAAKKPTKKPAKKAAKSPKPKKVAAKKKTVKKTTKAKK